MFSSGTSRLSNCGAWRVLWTDMSETKKLGKQLWGVNIGVREPCGTCREAGRTCLFILRLDKTQSNWKWSFVSHYCIERVSSLHRQSLEGRACSSWTEHMLCMQMAPNRISGKGREKNSALKLGEPLPISVDKTKLDRPMSWQYSAASYYAMNAIMPFGFLMPVFFMVSFVWTEVGQ